LHIRQNKIVAYNILLTIYGTNLLFYIAQWQDHTRVFYEKGKQVKKMHMLAHSVIYHHDNQITCTKHCLRLFLHMGGFAKELPSQLLAESVATTYFMLWSE
jgi:hypothetical protein